MKDNIGELKTIPHFQSWVLMWAFAESAIGGVMHALKIPFTGIVVGSISVICIALIGFYFAHEPKKIIQALGIVLLIKLTLSPYSPWQAYVAVFFQGYLGYFLYRTPTFFKLKTLIFSILCLTESAIQKVVLSILVFGTSLITAIDQSAQQIMFTLGIDTDTSFFYSIFTLYVLLYLLVGLLLGLWIPKIPNQLNLMRNQLALMTLHTVESLPQKKKLIKKGIVTLFVLLGGLLLIKIMIPDFPVFQLLWFLFRSILVSLILVFLLGPLVMKFVKKWVAQSHVDATLFTEVMRQIPAFSNQALALFSTVNKQYSGWNKVKYYIIGLIFLSMNEDHKT